MKTVLPFLFCLSAFAQSSPFTVTITPTFDKVKLEAYLRHLEVWPPSINMKIDDPKPAADLPGFNKFMVHLSYNDAHLDVSYFVTPDGRKIFKGDVYDIDKNPFQANIDKI